MIKILFVCHGNICRSPMAEFVMKDMVKRQGLADQFYIASAATSTEEIGNPVHYGTRNKLAQVGISTAGKYAVRMERRDYQEYDEDSSERGFFKAKPFGAGAADQGNYSTGTLQGAQAQTDVQSSYRRMPDTVFDKPAAGQDSRADFGKTFGTVQGKPKAVVRPKRTAIENQPYITRASQGVGAVSLEPVGNKTLAYAVGDRVRHMRYGEGTVLKIEPGPRDSQVTVVFDEAGQKIMYAGFAKLRKV